jgi:hypothetical protein
MTMPGMTPEIVRRHLEAAIGGSVQINNTDGWYSAGFTLDYTFEGQRVHIWVGDITIGVHKSAPIPSGATDIALVVMEWWGFGYSTIFTKNWPSPVQFCANIWGTTLNPKWEEVPCS